MCSHLHRIFMFVDDKPRNIFILYQEKTHIFDKILIFKTRVC